MDLISVVSYFKPEHMQPSNLTISLVVTTFGEYAEEIQLHSLDSFLPGGTHVLGTRLHTYREVGSQATKENGLCGNSKGALENKIIISLLK